MVWTVLAVVGVLGILYGMFRSHISERDAIKIWNREYELRGGDPVKTGWGTPLDKEGE